MVCAIGESKVEGRGTSEGEKEVREEGGRQAMAERICGVVVRSTMILWFSESSEDV